MFVLSILKDTVAVHPSSFGVPPAQALISALNKKYANRVLHDVGLCVCVFDLSEAGEGKVRYGDGFLWYKVVFRLVVFRPFASEVILAKVKSSDEDGIRLTISFFDDMYIPKAYLPQPSAFDPSERAHFWLAEPPETPTPLLDTPTSARMYIDAGELVRVRVEADEFVDDEPGPPDARVTEVRTKRAPYSVVCSIAEQGLGPVAWWKAAEPVEEEDGMEEE
ncbi:hypothetical protein PLICRDRAFT_165713 [Plicaturopsis crispa FD-325 SS-3]|nr:hypothetical protein PLICRDRAFT_165713 [Plicaturopsis crispa FD-325 SS-3]